MEDRVFGAAQEFFILALVFAAATILLQGLSALNPSDRLKRNWRVNLSYFSFDLLLVMPVMVLVTQGIQGLISEKVAIVWGVAQGGIFPPLVIVFLAVFVSDLAGYWRHRLMHSGLLWPVHAAHHSDEDVTWFTLVRFHPLNRLVAVVIDAVILSLLDFPIWALIFSNRLRHFYGYFIHSNIGWRYGPLKYIFVSPFLHRWHHATDLAARDKNFATIFSLFDVLFGTFYCPKIKASTLGVDDPTYPTGFWGQLVYPLLVWTSPKSASQSNATPAID